MQLNTIFIPSFDEQNQPKPNLTLIHGWGAESRVWESWATEYLAPYYSVTLVDLPGFGDSPILEKSDTLEDDWIEALNNAIPDNTHLLGWSLGGLLAQQIALRHPEKINSLICLATTPRFTQNDGWTRSVSPQIINDFIKAIGIEVNKTLKTFWRLQLQGTSNSRVLMKELVSHMSARSIPKIQPLNQGLILLKDMDNREQIHNLNMPTLWLLGEHDPLIPEEIRLNLNELQPKANVEIIADGGHIPFFSQPEQTANLIVNFLQKA